MALTKVAPAGIGSTPGDGYRIGSSFLHSTGVELTNANASGIVTAAQFDGKLNIGIATFSDDVTFAGANYNITFDKSDDSFKFPNNAKAKFGNSSQFQVYHDASNGVLSYGTGTLFATGSTFRVVNQGVSENIAWFKADAEVALYYNNTLRFQTSGIGVTVTGQLDVGNVNSTGVITATKFVGDIAVGSSITYADNEKGYFGTGLDLQLFHDGSQTSYIQSVGASRDLVLKADRFVKIAKTTGGNLGFQMLANDEVGLYHANNKKINTTSTGVVVTGICTSTSFSGTDGPITIGDGGGRVLLGHNASQEVYGTNRFQIQGTSATTSGMSLLRHGGSPYLALGSTGGSAVGAVNAVSSGNRLGQLTFVGADGTDVNTHAASIAAYVDGSVSSNTVPGRLVFATSSGPGELERMRIHSNGNVSIGNNPTVHADNIFHVEDSGETNVKFEGNTTTLGARLALQNNNTDAGAYDQIDFNDAGGQSTSSIKGFNTDQTNNYGELAFFTRNAQGSPPAERVRIDKDGKFGIGVDPASRLHVTESGSNTVNIQLTNGTTGHTHGSDGMTIGYSSSSSTGFINVAESGSGFLIKTGGTASSNERMVFSSSGGITLPSGSLRITDSGNSTANSTHTTGALRCNLIRSDTSNNNAYTGTYFMNVNAAGGGIKSVGIVETGLKVGNFTSNLAAAEKIKLTYDGHVEIKTDGGRLKIGAGNDLQMYHDNGGSVNHITCVNNQQLKVSCNALTVYEYTGNTLAFNVDADRKIRTNGAAATGHTGMIYIQGLSDPAAMQTKSNLTVRGEGGNGFACGTYEGTGNYGSWIQAGYVENFSTAVYPLILNPNGNCVCIGNYDNASTTDGGLLRVQSRHGTNFYNDAALTIEHYNQSNAREQKWHFITASNQGTEAKSNSKFRQMAVPYTSSTDYQCFTDQIVYAHTVGHNSVNFYKFNARASSSDRGGSCRMFVTWSSRHAGPAATCEYTFGWYDEHHTSRINLYLRKRHYSIATGGGSYYGWTGNPSIDVYSCTGGGSGAAFYLKVFGHISANSGTYDGGIVHHFHIIHNDNNTGGNNSYFEFVGNSNPGDLGSSLSLN